MLGLHALLMLISLIVLSFSVLFASMFLLQDRNVRLKKFFHKGIRLPSLETARKMNFVSLSVGTLTLFVGTVAGIIYFRGLGYDWRLLGEPLVILSTVMMIVYFVLLRVRAGHLERGRRYAWMTILAYVLLIAAVCYSSLQEGAIH